MDATRIAAPPSTKSAKRARDPEMHQPKKGNPWYFGMQAHIGADRDSKLVHTVVVTAANVADITQTAELLHGAETQVQADAGYPDRATIAAIKVREEGKATKVINLIKRIQKTAEEESDDPFLIALTDRAKAVQESFEDRQASTEDALAELLAAIEKNEQRKQEQAAKGLDGLIYFVLCKLTEDGIPHPEAVSRKVAAAFGEFPNWKSSEQELREARKRVAFALFAELGNYVIVHKLLHFRFQSTVGSGKASCALT